MTWKHLEGAENGQICPGDSLCPVHSRQLLGTDANTDMLLGSHILPGLQGLKETRTQNTSPTPLLTASAENSKRRRLRQQQPGGCGALLEATV